MTKSGRARLDQRQVIFSSDAIAGLRQIWYPSIGQHDVLLVSLVQSLGAVQTWRSSVDVHVSPTVVVQCPQTAESEPMTQFGNIPPSGLFWRTAVAQHSPASVAAPPAQSAGTVHPI